MPKTSYQNTKEYRRNTRLKLFYAFGAKCGHCGLVDDPIIYDFHHLNADDKSFTISEVIRSWEKVVAEAAKCVMLCALCHRKYHAGLISLSLNVARFDDNLIPHEFLKKRVRKFDDCPRCGKSKYIRQKSCSMKCRSEKIDWDKIDLPKLLHDLKSFVAVGRFLGVSDNAVRKQMRRRGQN